MDAIAEVGNAFVTVAPSAKGFGRALNGQVTKETKGTGSKIGSAVGKMAAGAFGATAIVGGIAKSISLAKDFDLTIRQVGVQTGQSGAALKSMSDLALKMGKDTAFSAKDASDAMLELAKGGMTAAQIKAGALKTTLTLAAAGGLELGSAAGFVVQGMTTFGLKASQANQVAVALAGGANASTASVESLGQALSQVGPGAKNAGLSLQETVGTLAAFDNAGIKGSDAGTSLKTMLTRLVPATDKASTAMDLFGLNFIDKKGNIDDISTVAQKLQKHLGGLSQAERTQALSTIFGSDATRAATVLMNNGAKGMEKYIRATKNQATVQKMANTAMGGASGAWDSFTGSVETLMIQLGTKLLPIFTQVTQGLSSFLNDMMDGKGAAGQFAAVLGTIGAAALSLAGFISRNKAAVATFVAVLLAAKGAALGYAAAQRVLATVQAVQAVSAGLATTEQIALNAAMRANVIGLIVTALALLVAGLVYAYKHSETFRNIVNGAFRAVLAVGKLLWTGLRKYFQLLAAVWLTIAGVIIKGAAKAFGWIPGIGGKIKALAKGFDKFKANVNRALGGIKDKTVNVHANTAAASAALTGIQRQVGALDGAHAAVTVGVTRVGAKIGANAAGTNDWRGGLSMVGERGPELVDLPRHSRVIPNHELGRHGGSSGAMRVHVVNPGDIAVATDSRADRRVVAHAGIGRESLRARR